jgi:hypothetical protein
MKREEWQIGTRMSLYIDGLLDGSYDKEDKDPDNDEECRRKWTG